MATKKVKTDKKGTKARKPTDPFATTVEPVPVAATSEKPKRGIKVIKAAKLINAAKGPNTTIVPSKRAATDAFAEIAAPAPKSDEIAPHLSTGAVKAKPINARTTKEIEKLFGAKVVNADPAMTPDVTDVNKSKAKAPALKQKRAAVIAKEPIAVAEIATLPDATPEIALKKPEVELSPVFRALADVELPELPRENRARLQMQSPTRLYFYWSLRQNPWQQLRAVFGPELGSYTLVLKLRNLSMETEEIRPVETEGEWWFNDAEPDSEYTAEVGFYATNRPYFRFLYSNTVTTPRRSPSPHPATEARWTVSATKFAEVLDASGFTRDAVDVAILGDDHLDAEQRTNLAFAELMSGAEYSTKCIAAEDIRHAILALAGGVAVDGLRHRVSASLFDVLQSNSKRLSSSGARKALTEHFDVDESEWTEEEFGPTVFGASIVNFPKTLKSLTASKHSPRYNPVSSFSIGR